MEPVELTQEQHLYLQFILDNFRAESRWPTHRQVDRFFYQTDPDMDIEEIWKSLPPGLTSYLDINLLDNPASLTLEGIYALEPGAPEFALFLWVLDLCVRTYSASEGDTLRSEDIGCILEEAGVTSSSTSSFAASRQCSSEWRHLT
jgi:hypothetical protein